MSNPNVHHPPDTIFPNKGRCRHSPGPAGCPVLWTGMNASRDGAKGCNPFLSTASLCGAIEQM